MTAAIYDNCHTCWNSCPANSTDVCIRLLQADADGVRLVTYTRVAYIDIKTARADTVTGLIAQCNIGVAGCVEIERTETGSRVETAARIAPEFF